MMLPRLYAIADYQTATRHGWTLPDLARAYLAGGARLVQVRAPEVSSGQLLAWCDAIVREAEAVAGHVIVNDRADLAVLSGASGVHVGQTDLPVSAVRRVVGPARLVGLSTHSSAQLREAISQPLDYVALGPVYATGTKDTGYRGLGIRRFRDLASGVGHPPLVAIGGITLERAPGAIEAGATSVAVIADLLAGGDPERRVAAYVRALESRSK